MFQLKTLADQISAQYVGQEVSATSVSIDTRTLRPGALFVAIEGPSFDGHDFISQAISQGAAAVMVKSRLNLDVPQLIVDDSYNYPLSRVFATATISYCCIFKFKS